MKKILLSGSFVWIPFGLHSGVGMGQLAPIYQLLVLLAAWMVVDKILARHTQ